jgi:deazaflavin-dependent oxidoreductase (nitroreductase family)
MASESMQHNSFVKLEQAVFRSLNSVVEPAVRFGIGSPTFTPASLIVLETVGFKSGLQRRTPLWSIRLGRYRLVSTGRGERSFWVKNLLQQPVVSFYLGGRRRVSRAIVITEGNPLPETSALSPAMRKVVKVLHSLAPKGWAFAVLAPAKR